MIQIYEQNKHKFIISHKNQHNYKKFNDTTNQIFIISFFKWLKAPNRPQKNQQEFVMWFSDEKILFFIT